MDLFTLANRQEEMKVRIAKLEKEYSKPREIIVDNSDQIIKDLTNQIIDLEAKLLIERARHDSIWNLLEFMAKQVGR